jgi:NAD(P)-dependent dehydrogenase (short-subunit alcohol dehydrogenase family)
VAAPDPAADGQWLAGRTALVTGAGLSGLEGGVGYAVDRVFARHGAAVAVLDRDPQAADRTVEASPAGPSQGAQLGTRETDLGSPIK